MNIWRQPGGIVKLLLAVDSQWYNWEMPPKRPKQPHPGRRGLALHFGDKSTDEAVQAMFKLTPEESRRIIAATSPNPKPKPKRKAN
jgi:hypothetical protein